MSPPVTELAKHLQHAGRVLAEAGVVTAFGHMSVRLDRDHAVITPAAPLRRVEPDRCLVLDLNADTLPVGAPGEAWLHVAILRERSDANAVCRAQPETVTAMAAARVGIPALTGHAVLAGAPVPIAPDATLIRNHAAAKRAAAALGTGTALILPGNGAVTIGATVGAAVARMWLLERAAVVTAAAAAAGTVTELAPSDVTAWRSVAGELLGRVWDYLAEKGNSRDRS